MTHGNRNWQRRWVLDDDGMRIVHENGLIVFWNGRRAVADPDSSKALGERITAEQGTDRHVGATVYGLLGQAEKLFIRRHQP